MNKRAGIFLIGVIVLIVLLISYGIVYFRFTSSGLEVLSGNNSISLDYQNNISISDNSTNTMSQPLNITGNTPVNTTTPKSNRTKIEIVEVNISK